MRASKLKTISRPPFVLLSPIRALASLQRSRRNSFRRSSRWTVPHPASTAGQAWDWPSRSNWSDCWAVSSALRALRVRTGQVGEPGVPLSGLPLCSKNRPPKQIPEPTPTADLTGVRVLVVDDNETNRLLVTNLLKNWGCRFAEAADGEAALHRLREATTGRRSLRRGSARHAHAGHGWRGAWAQDQGKPGPS